MNEREIFDRALELADEAARSAYLDGACGENQPLREHIAGLLKAEQALGGFLQVPAVAVAAEHGEMLDQPMPERVGMTIGAYKLIEEIAEGGMGTVWMAQQTKPVKRLVAVKLVKAGMDTKQVIARFEAERQALALMDHPNIAKVLDAGATPDGRPFFVLELVKGVPVTKFCDERRLTPRQRLEMFVPVCQAIQHAHQKGIIHRDLKPSNVLVALYDDRPVPKVIDFGVAKATGQPLTERTLHTGFGAVVGTVEYMSPEQAGFNQLDVDTRSDIYSLGVLLYELLTGTPPFTRTELEQAGVLEMLRVIRDEEPTKPSTKLSTSAGLPALAASRGTESAKLTNLVRGDLDWIVMKALDKDRARRYQTASGLAADVERYLKDEPVEACPPSSLYRFHKFARRNQGAVLAASAIVLLLSLGILGTSWGLWRAENARQAEIGQRKRAEAAVLSERAAKGVATEQRNRAEQAHQKAAREAAIAAAINDFLNKDLLQLSPLEQATPGRIADADLKLRSVLLRAANRIGGRFANEPEVEMQIRYTIANALPRVGEYAAALAQYQKVVPYFQETLGPDHPETLLAEYHLAVMHWYLGQSKTALPLLEQNLEKHKAALGLAHAQTLVSMSGLGSAYWDAGQKEKALQLYEQTLELRKRHLGPAHPDTLASMNNVAAWYLLQMQVDKALPLFEETFAGVQKNLAPAHPERMNITLNLARAYHAAEQIDKAIPLLETLMRLFNASFGLDYPLSQTTADDLIAYYMDMGWWAKAASLQGSVERGGYRPTIGNSRPIVPGRLDPGAIRPPSEKKKQDLREKPLRDLLLIVRPAAVKYEHELAAKGAEHPDTLAAQQAFALVLRKQDRTSGAAYHLQAVLDARERLLDADHPDLDASRLELGSLRLEQKKYSQAEPLLLAAYAGLKAQPAEVPDAKSRMTETLQLLVQLYNRWDKPDQAEEWRQRLDQQKQQ